MTAAAARLLPSGSLARSDGIGTAFPDFDLIRFSGAHPRITSEGRHRWKKL
jgi:hypothetical protein